MEHKMTKALLMFFFVLFTATVEAHPGRTAADGCHYCRTNCDEWGVPWNARHCHNGNKIEVPLKSAFVETTEEVEHSSDGHVHPEVEAKRKQDDS